MVIRWQIFDINKPKSNFKYTFKNRRCDSYINNCWTMSPPLMPSQVQEWGALWGTALFNGQTQRWVWRRPSGEPPPGKHSALGTTRRWTWSWYHRQQRTITLGTNWRSRRSWLRLWSTEESPSNGLLSGAFQGVRQQIGWSGRRKRTPFSR